MTAIIHIKKVMLVVALLIMAGIMLLSAGKILKSKNIETAKRLPIYSVGIKEKKIALTFDCAWENSDTDELIEILKSNNIQATFFTTGDWCNRFPDDVKKLSDAGHSIQNHSYSHPHVNNISENKIIEDTKKCEDKILEITGKKPTLYRSPYGEYNNKVIATVEDNLGYKIIQWDCDSTDWQGKSAEFMVEKMTKNAKEGSILLFHNDTKNTPRALRQLIPVLKGNGFEFVLVDDLIYKENYSLDNAGRQQRN